MTTAPPPYRLELRGHGAVFVLDGSPSAASPRPGRGLRGAEAGVDGRTVRLRLTAHRARTVAGAIGHAN